MKTSRAGRVTSNISASSTSNPGLPAVDWSSINQAPPKVLSTSDWDPNKEPDKYGSIDMIIMTWTSAEWAAFDQVMTGRTEEMPYNGEGGNWKDDWVYYYDGWQYNVLSAGSPSISETAWGSCLVVEFPQNNKRALLYKSSMHISTDGPTLPLRNMVQQLIGAFSPDLVLTIGTAGGAIPGDNLGSANITNGGKCDLSGEFSGLNFWFNEQTFWSNWKPQTKFVKTVQEKLCQQVPITDAWIQSLYDSHTYELTDPCTNKPYTLDQLKNSTIAPGKIPAVLTDYSGEKPVLTTNGYEVATTSGDFKEYAAMEMDDAIIGMVCNANKVNFGVVRNISDPVQNADINGTVAGSWGEVIYSAFGFYSSYNGALAAWAIAAAE